MKERALSPSAIAVALSLGVVAFLVVGAASVALSVFLSLHAVKVSTDNAANTERVAAVQECKALRALDDSHQGIVFPAVDKAHPSEEALTRLFTGIHGVYVDSGCPALLKR